MQQPARDRFRFGIGEWYGRLFHKLTRDERALYATLQEMPKKSRPPQPCPFQSEREVVPCTKAGGVCSVRRYVERAGTRQVEIVPDGSGRLRTVCPYRFRENGLIYGWVSQELLGDNDPRVVSEVGFLTGVKGEESDEAEGSDVGRIDQVLIAPGSKPLEWCALEIQAVYVSGASMGGDFEAIKNHTDRTSPFPAGYRHPDYRSSGPKRLMPQLQIKVPTLRRWGKKMVVVVDRDFFEALASMDRVRDVSNCDIAWFIVDLDDSGTSDRAHLTPGDVRLTTLERAVEGLTAGLPVSKEEFERRILNQLAAQEKRQRGA